MFRFAVLLVLLLPGLAQAQTRKPSHCIAVAQGHDFMQYANFDRETVHFASVHSQVSVPPDTVRLQYIAHASFLIETHGGLSAVTDFTGFIGNVDFLPDVVTMNHAHTSHWTANPDPDIKHVLKGWGEVTGEAVDHHLDLDEMLVRNVSTDIRSEWSGRETNGNSIFVFEVAGLCVGHLGHLHHEPSDEQYAALGRLDVVMAPVDGGMTLPLPVMIRVIDRLRSSIVIPMHWFSGYSLEAFVTGTKDRFDVVRLDADYLDVSLRTLPRRPTVMIMQPRYLQENE